MSPRARAIATFATFAAIAAIAASTPAVMLLPAC
jgi:hypothetical protein